jgi:hypothetical protein
MVQASNSSNNTTQSTKDIYFYNLVHGIMNMKKHVVNEHGANLNQYKE